MSTKETQKNFKIKLLSGNNVVLVECDKFDSEIFVPYILNGRITFQNIVPGRRCCDQAGVKLCRNPTSTSNIATQDRKHLSSLNLKLVRVPAGSEKSAKSSLVTSNAQSKPTISADKENTPEPVRRMSSPQRQKRHTPLALPTYEPSKEPYQEPQTTTSTPKSTQKAQKMPNLMSKLLNKSLNDTGFVLPSTPPAATSRPESNYVTPKDSAPPIPKSITALLSTDRWRKCITPLRTYSLQKNNKTQAQRHVESSLAAKMLKKVVPTYLANPTKGMPATHVLPVNKRKLKIDRKSVLSPRVNKQRRTAVKSKIHKKRRGEQILALNMLTQPSRRRQAKALQRQFRNACVDKTMSTYPKFKLLAKPALEPVFTLTTSESQRQKRTQVAAKKTKELQNITPIRSKIARLY